MLTKFIVGNEIKTSGTNQPSTKQDIFTKLHVKCLLMNRFSELKLLQKDEELLNTSGLGSSSYLGANILQN